MAGKSAYVVKALVATALVVMPILGTPRPAAAAKIIYVNHSAAGANNGTSWANAYKSLQTALAHASSGDEIWVAKGSYKPTAGTDRTKSFHLKKGVALYGGFAGLETLLGQRNPKANVTVLSGEIGAPGMADNSYHVVRVGSVDQTAVLDGFTIRAGNANGGFVPDDRGGGLFVYNGSPTLANLDVQGNGAVAFGAGMEFEYSVSALSHIVMEGNSAGAHGGALYLYAAPLTLANVTLRQNTATNKGGAVFAQSSNVVMKSVVFYDNSAVDGGAIYNSASSPKVTNAIFLANRASQHGGALYNTNSSNPQLKAVTFEDNESTQEGGAIYDDSSSPALTNVTLAGNTSGTYGGAIYNINGGDPLLINVTASGNSATNLGGGMYNENESYPTVSDSIFWGDGTEIGNSISSTTLVDSILQGGCPATPQFSCTNVLNQDPVLQPLGKHGGFTKTMPLGAGSAALNAGGANSTCAPKDQRGVKRPQGPACDMGAYEVNLKTFRSQAAYDGWVLESGEQTGQGGTLDSVATTIRVGDSAANKQYRGFLSFDTSSLPDGAAVLFAGFRVRPGSVVAGVDPFITHGNLMLDLKKPYFATGPDLELADFNAPSTAASAGQISDTLVNGWMEGLLYGGTVNKMGLTQFRMRFTLDDDNDHKADFRTFFSGDASKADRPQLIVYYNP